MNSCSLAEALFNTSNGSGPPETDAGVKSIALTLADDDAGALALEALASLDALMASPLSCAEGGPMLVGTLALAPASCGAAAG
ncbi:hypothetical protein FE36_05360 [Xanthomonas oryzae pv. oryzicola]|nr:hypothetical protein FE36_05360 [Xanthomonas oryzae pv. oryzicola]